MMSDMDTYKFVGNKNQLYELNKLKENANCPASEKQGEGPGSCGGGNKLKNVKDISKLVPKGSFVHEDGTFEYNKIGGTQGIQLIARLKNNYKKQGWQPKDVTGNVLVSPDKSLEVHFSFKSHPILAKNQFKIYTKKI